MELLMGKFRQIFTELPARETPMWLGGRGGGEWGSGGYGGYGREGADATSTSPKFDLFLILFLAHLNYAQDEL